MYDEDLRAQGEPAAVTQLKAQVREADAVLIVTPEYNFSIPGVLKNALDWASRPPEPPFDDKVVALMGASTGMAGTARVQYDLRKGMVFLNAFVVNKPEVFIREAPSKFDASGALVDEPTRKFIAELLLSTARLAQRLHPR
jgi:chromate reductase